MAAIIESVRYNLANVARLSGRSAPGQFWPYAILMFVLSMIVAFLVMIPMLADMMIRTFRYLEAHPEGLPQTPAGAYGGQALPPELMPDMASVMTPLAAVNALFAAFLAAAVVRRLHDRDRSGLWALLPVPFMILGYVLAPTALPGLGPAEGQDSTAFLFASLNNAFYWIAMIALIVMLVPSGTAGPNRFGEPGS